MTELAFYQVDAFADRQFTGNPAAVCPLETWLPDVVMQSIAAENNLAETAFLVGSGERYQLRWFTPAVEVDLCGHATLAAAHVLWNERGVHAETFTFETRSGELTVARDGQRISLDFPAEIPHPVDPAPGLYESMGVIPEACLMNQDYVLVYPTQADVEALTPDFRALGEIDCRGVIATAVGENHDFVCRFFGPAVGIDEDPVTGSAFTKLIPLWAERLSKTGLTARQISARGGDVWCEMSGNRVLISGHACTVVRGSFSLQTGS